MSTLIKVSSPFVVAGMAKMGVDNFKKHNPPTQSFAFDTNHEYEYNQEITIHFKEGPRKVRFQGFKLNCDGPCPAESILDHGTFVSRRPAFLYSSPLHRGMTKLKTKKELDPTITVYYSEKPVEGGVHKDPGTNPEGQQLFGDLILKNPQLRSYSQRLTKENDPGIIGAVKRAFEK